MSAWVFPIFIASQYFASGSIFPVFEDNIVFEDYTGLEWETFFFIHFN